MTHHQPPADTDRRDAPSADRPVFGLGVATGILGIFGSISVFSLAGYMTLFALGRFSLVGLLAAAYWVLAVATLAVGILIIVRNRRRNSTLPLLLLGITILVVVFSLAATLTGLTGGAWWLVSINLLPLIIVALLAYLEARKSSLQHIR